MAETKGGKRYGHGPKIADKGQLGSEHKDVKPDKDGTPTPQGSEVSGSDHIPTKREEPEGDQPGKVEPGLKETRGYEMPTHERHLAERKEMMKRHGSEMEAMHERHGKEHSDMAKRHETELGGEAKAAA